MSRCIPTTCALVAALATGCDEGSSSIGGELGRGEFEYICINDTDPACSGFLEAARFPQVFAVGGQFWARFWPEAGGQVPQIDTAAPQVLSVQGTVLTFERDGTAAVLAVRNDELVDYVHLDAQPIASVTFEREDEQAVGSLRLDFQEEARVDVTPNDAGGRELGGALPYSWRVVDPSIAELVSPDNVDDVTVRGLAEGQTALEVTVGDFTTSLLVTVEFSDVSTSTTDDGSTDGSTGDDTSSSTGSGSTSGGTTTEGSSSGTGGTTQ